MANFLTLGKLTDETARTLNFGERVKLMLDAQKRSKFWLASEIGISKQAMNYLLNHSSSIKFLNEISLALGVNPEWLKTGNGPIYLADHDNRDILHVPIIPIMEVPNYNYNNRDSYLDKIVASSSLPVEAFAIKLDNTSMEPIFNRGCILIFNPHIKAKNGDYVIFSTKETEGVFFRQLFFDGNDIYLKSIDSSYRTIMNNGITFYGVLVESRNVFN